MPTHLHIVSTGTSVISNYERLEKKSTGFNLNDQGQIAKFLAQDPCAASAEINSLQARTGFLERGGQDLSITLVHSATDKGQRAAAVLERFLKDKVGSFRSLPVIGFDRPANEHYPPEDGAKDAAKSLSDLKNKITSHITTMRDRFESVQINCTGGFKAESAVLYRVGIELSVPVYYMHESFRCCVDLPAE